MKTEHQGRSGPIEDLPWPDRLTARVVDPAPAPALHGYDIQTDLAVHYRFGEYLLLALSGTPPDERTGRAFEVALVFGSTISIADAPTHAASLARLCGAMPSGVLATGVLTLLEEVRAEVEGHRELLAWLERADTPVPESARAKDEDDRAAVHRLRACLTDADPGCPALQHDLALAAAVIALLHHVGLRREDQLLTALCVARMGLLTAEASAAGEGTLRQYPVGLPPFDYQEP